MPSQMRIAVCRSHVRPVVVSTIPMMEGLARVFRCRTEGGRRHDLAGSVSRGCCFIQTPWAHTRNICWLRGMDRSDGGGGKGNKQTEAAATPRTP